MSVEPEPESQSDSPPAGPAEAWSKRAPADDTEAWARLISRRKPRPEIPICEPQLEPSPEPEHEAGHPAVELGGLTASPLTDPRALGSSFILHVVVLVIASLAALGVGLPVVRDTAPTTLRGEIGPVDNRALEGPGGGSPGELGGSDTVRMAADGQSPESQALSDPAADALISEILPSPTSSDSAQRALPGPLTTGLGLLGGLATGGGGGSGGGAGGGVGRGIGPGTAFFGAREHAGSFAYVIDCSGSMAVHKSLDLAKRELLASLAELPPDARFGIVFYNISTTVFTDDLGREILMPATASNKDRVRSLLSRVEPDGGTDHLLALRAGLALKPEVIFFLTDADLMTFKNAEEILREVGSTRIQAIEFGLGPQFGDSAPLRKLATASGGSYRYIDVTRLPKPGG